jgi:predicted amidohydrolase YtcJ
LHVAAQQSAPEIILTNGKVFTAEAGAPFAEAVAIRGDRIIAVGTDTRINALAGPKTRRIDLGGRVVVPGFNDAHFHFMPDPRGYTLQFKPQAPGAPPEPSWQETLEAIKAAVKQVPQGTWIFGYVGVDVVLDPQATRSALDQIAPNHPVLLRAYYGHGYILNTKAMPLLQIAVNEPDPAGGYYERMPGTNKINGKFWEYAEWKPNRILVNQVSDEDAIKALKGLADEAARLGITSMQIMSAMSVDRFARLLVKADLPIRVRAIPFSMTTPQGRDLSEIRQLAKLRFHNSKVTVSGIKWVLDGTPFERGAALRRSYNDRAGWSGKLNFTESEITAMIRESLQFSQQLLVHCVGDKCAETVFNAMEQIRVIIYLTDHIAWRDLLRGLELGRLGCLRRGLRGTAAAVIRVSSINNFFGSLGGRSG